MSSGTGRDGKGVFVVIYEAGFGGGARTEDGGLVGTQKGYTGTHPTGYGGQRCWILILFNTEKTPVWTDR